MKNPGNSENDFRVQSEAEQSCGCPSEKLLVEFATGELTEPEIACIADHIDACEQCQNSLRELEVDDTLLTSLRSAETQLENVAVSIPKPFIEVLKQIPVTESSLLESHKGALEPGSDLSVECVAHLFGPAQQSDELGRLGHFRILRFLGHGGMGAVFLAEDTKLDRPVALKVMLPRISCIAAARTRFFREAKAAAGLKSDHVVTIYQVDECHGAPFLAMELLRGQTLEDALRSRKQIEVGEAIKIARDIAAGLMDAHHCGLVHRDIKPANIWLETVAGGSLRVKILDFGLARSDVAELGLTDYGSILGTPAYMAPEQARADRVVDPRADLFSLGCVLYQMCTGVLPFQADTTVGILMAIALNTPVEPIERNPSVPPDLSQLIMHLLQKDPLQRPQSASDVVRQLTRIEGDYVEHIAPSVTRSRALTQPAPIQPRFWWVMAGLGCVASILLAAQILLWNTPEGRIVLIESNDPNVQLAFNHGQLKVTGAYDDPITIRPGKVNLKISKPQANGQDFIFETDKLVVRKGEDVSLKIEVLAHEVRIIRNGKGLIESKALPAQNADELIQDKELLAATWGLSSGAQVAIDRYTDRSNGVLAQSPFNVDNLSELPGEAFVVKEIKFLNRRHVDGKGFVHFRDLKHLNILKVEIPPGGGGVSGADFENLRACTDLTHFQTSGCNVTDTTLEYLKELPRLREVGIGDRPGITDAGITTLKQFPELQVLHLGGSSITDACLTHFRDFKKLSVLGFSGIAELTDDGLVQIAALKNLRVLDLAATGAGDKTARTLSENSYLTDLNLAYCPITDQGLEYLQAIRGLRFLNIVQTSVSTEAIQRFRSAVPGCEIQCSK